MMFSKIRRKLHVTPSGVIAIIALVFALTGGAFAATSGTGNGNGGGRGNQKNSSRLLAGTSKAKSKTKAGPRGPAGKNGTNGTNGAPGATGPAGPAGPAGTAGGTGPAGGSGETGPQGPAGPTGPQGPEGKQGVIHPGKPVGSPEPLPEKATETGSWSLSVGEAEADNVDTSISFTIPLATALPAEDVHYVNEEGKEEVTFNGSAFEAVATSDCPGTTAEPAASPGNLCVYQQDVPIPAVREEKGIAENFIYPSDAKGDAFLPEGAATTGAIVGLVRGENVPIFAYGTWAVTAP